MPRLLAWTALIAVAVWVACDDSSGATPDDAGGNDARQLQDSPDALDDPAADLEEDADTAADVAGEPDAVDEPDLAPVDAVEVIDEPPPGIDCSDDAALCEGEFTCIDGVCTLDPHNHVFVEQSYTIREPEEVSHVFDFIKTFAADVAFFMLEVSEEGDPDRRPARYGTADRIVQPDTLDVVYRWQFDTVDRLLLTPYRGDSGLEGDAWQSNMFQWNLQAHIVLEDLRVDTIIGFVGELAQVFVRFDDDLRGGAGEFHGVITRREAENRVFDNTAFEPFRQIICRVHPDLVPDGESWTLADILDCNAAPMDVDLNGDGILDGYNTIVDFLIEEAQIAPPEE